MYSFIHIFICFLLVIPSQSEASLKKKYFFETGNLVPYTYDSAYHLFNKGRGIEDHDIVNLNFDRRNLWMHLSGWEKDYEDILLIENANLDSIFIFYLSDGKLIDQHLTGDHLSFFTRAFNNIFFNLKIPQGTDEILLRINSQGNLSIPIFVLNDKVYITRNTIYVRINTIYLGFALLTVITLFLIYMWSKETIYLYYIIYIVIIVMIITAETGIKFKVIWPGIPHLNDELVPYIYLSGFYLLFFNEKVLYLEKGLPKIYKYYRLFYWLFPILVVVVTFVDLYISFQILFNVLLLIQIICLITAAVSYFRYRVLFELFFIAGWIVFLVLSFTYSLMLLDILAYNIFTNCSLQLGFAAQIIFFNAAIAAKIFFLQRENESILEKQNLLLESKVQESTRELREKQVEILNKNELLNTQNTILESQTQDLKEYRQHLEEMVNERTQELFLSKQNLELSQEIFIFLAESIPQLVYVTSKDGIAQYVNKRWVNYTGLDLEKTRNGGWISIVHPDERAESYEYWKECVRENKNYEAVFRIKDIRTNKYKWHIARGLPFYDKNGKTLQWFGTFTDIDQQKRNNEKLENIIEELNKSNEDLDNFIYLASHELKTPASNIEGIVIALFDILDNQDIEDKEYQILLNMIIESLNTLKSVIKNLEEISKVQRNKVNSHERINIKEAIYQVIKELDNEIKETNATININIADDSYLQFDKEITHRIIYTLLSNAILYKHPDRNPIIDIYYSDIGDYNKLEVKDNGLGIKEEYIPKVFQMFERLHTHVEGSGISLYAIKRLLSNSEGQIEVASKEGEGSNFCIYIKKQYKIYKE